MKTYNFVYTMKSEKISRTYGGSDYVLAVYEVTKDGLNHLGDAKGCTRGHMGYEHEAFRVVRKERPNVIKLLARRIKKAGKDNWLKPLTDKYYNFNYRDYGVKLQSA